MNMETPRFPVDLDEKQRQGRADFTLLTSVAKQQSLIFSPNFDLFPQHLRLPVATTVPALSDLFRTTGELQNQVEELQRSLSDIPAFQLDTVEEYKASSRELVAKMADLSHDAQALNIVFEMDLRPWIASVKSPEMQGLGPAANEALEKLASLQQLLQQLKSIRLCHSQLAKFRLGGETQHLEATKLCHLATECETEVAEVNDMNAVLRNSIARDREQQHRR